MIPSTKTGKKNAMTSILYCSPSSYIRRRRQRWGQKRSMLLFLTVATLLSFFGTFGKIDKGYNDNNNNDDGDEPIRSNRIGRSVETGWDREHMVTMRTTTVNIVDPTYDLPKLLSSPRSKEDRSRMWIVLAYHESCEVSMELLRTLKFQAIPRIVFNHDDSGDSNNLLRAEMNFVPMPIEDDGIGAELQEKFLKRLEIYRLPSLFFLWDEEKEHEKTWQLEDIFATAEVYRGRSESISDLVNGLYHYLSRLQLRPASLLTHQEYRKFSYRDFPLTAIQVQSMQDLWNIIRNANELKILQNPTLPLDPDLSEDDDNWIRYLMDDNSGTSNNDRDMNDRKNDNEKRDEERKDGGGSCSQCQSVMAHSYHAVIQCRNSIEKEVIDEEKYNSFDDTRLQAQPSSKRSIVHLYQDYNQAIRALGARRDVLFSILQPHAEDRNSSQFTKFCNSPSDDGLVKVWDFRSNKPLAELRHEEEHKKWFSEGYLNNSAGILDALSSWLRPEVLWFDRRMTAPIALHPRYLRHAILFVDLHDRDSAWKTRDVVRLFREECRRLKMEQLHHSVVKLIDGDDVENSLVCLVVPSTEIRVLNTFGIDIWSHLDRHATEKIKSTLCRSHMFERNGATDDLFCDGYKSHTQPKNVESGDSKFSSDLPTLLVTDRQRDASIQRYYLDPPITPRSLGEFMNDFVHGRIEPEKKNGRVSAGIHFTEDGRHKFPTNKHFVHLLNSELLPLFLESNREKHVLVELYAPTCGHCKRFNAIWNSLGELIKFLGWSDLLLLARIDVTSNEIILPGMTAAWLPDLFYFGVGVSENPRSFAKTPLADEIELGSISDPLDLLEWWMDEAGDPINEEELLQKLDGIITAYSV